MALESLQDQTGNANPPRVKAEKFDKFMKEREVSGDSRTAAVCTGSAERFHLRHDQSVDRP